MNNNKLLSKPPQIPSTAYNGIRRKSLTSRTGLSGELVKNFLEAPIPTPVIQVIPSIEDIS